MIEPSDDQAVFAERLHREIAAIPHGPELADIEGTWRRPHLSDTSHHVKEEWEAQFFTACNIWYSRVGSARDEGAQRCVHCLKVLGDKGNEG